MPLPFDERLVVCDKLRSVSHVCRLVLFVMLAGSACSRPDDLRRKHDEVLATAVAYQSRFDELKRRADEIDQRVRALPPATLNSAATQRTLAVVRTTIDQNRAYLRQVPTMTLAWMTSGEVRELQKLLDAMRQRLEDSVIEATSDVAAVESWTALAEQQQGSPHAPAAPPEPVPEPVVEDRNPTEGSGAPIR
jgi:hypothetical protein